MDWRRSEDAARVLTSAGGGTITSIVGTGGTRTIVGNGERVARGGFTPVTNHTFNVITYPSRTNNLATTNYPPGTWTSAYNANALTLTAP